MKKRKFIKNTFIIISKSGNTTETLANMFSLNIIKKQKKHNYNIRKKDNLLFLLARKFYLFFVEHKNYIGGRYSVLSEVGLLPAYIMGLNIYKFRTQILECLKEKNKSFLKESTIKLASLINSKKFNNLIFLNYSPELEKFLFWSQQLIDKVLEKNKGFLPVISNAPKDHHSLLQLYLDGPKDKLFNIFSCEQKSREKVNINKSLGIKNFLNNKKIGIIKNAQKSFN